MTVAIRNVNVASDDVTTWPFEAIVTLIERGTIGDWAVLGRAIGADPWGGVARQVSEWVALSDEPDVAALLRRRIVRARADLERNERAEVAARVRQRVSESGLTSAEFARRIGTSRTRLSTYCAGSVTPSAALFLRIDRVTPRDDLSTSS